MAASDDSQIRIGKDGTIIRNNQTSSSSTSRSYTPSGSSGRSAYTPASRSRESRRSSPLFEIVDRDSGEGSEFLFGILGAGIGIGIGTLVGGFFGTIIGAILGWILISEFVGKRIHVNIGKAKIIVILGSIIISILSTVIFNISSMFRSKTTTSQTAAVSTTAATVTTDILYMYEGASLEGSIIKSIKRGETVSVLGEVKDGWANIKHGSDSGYVPAASGGVRNIIIAGEQNERIQAASLVNGMFTFWPRLQAMRDEKPVKDIFIPQIIVSGSSVIIYFCSNTQGIYGYDLIDADWNIIWDTGVDGFYDKRYFSLQDLDNPSRIYEPIEANYTNNGMGKIWYLTFAGIQSTRFQLTGKQYSSDESPFIFEEIIITQPD